MEFVHVKLLHMTFGQTTENLFFFDIVSRCGNWYTSPSTPTSRKLDLYVTNTSPAFQTIPVRDLMNIIASANLEGILGIIR